jgi:deazaflavin-dependent oxidoreductase (nitroreductase family)
VSASEEPYLHLTTTGRRTGQPREAELWFTRRADCYYVIAEDRERAHWVRNLLAHPRVTWRVEGRTFAGRARVLDGAAGVPVQALSAAKYGWGDGLVVELVPDTPLT